MSNGKAVLLVVEGTDTGKMLEAGLSRLNSFAPDWMPKSLAMKTNTDSADPYPVNIDMELIQPMVRYIKDSGTEDVIICDAPTTGMDKDRAFKGLGYFALEKQSGVRIVAGDAGARSQFVPVRDDRWEISQSIDVFRPLHEASFIINVVVPKRHVAARLTCALKNHFGSVYGPERWSAHRKAEEGADGTKLFDKTLSEFADAVRPELTIVDARSLLTKDGPKLRGRSEVKRNINKLILSGDMVATDAYCADLMKKYDDTFDPEMIALQLSYAEEIGLGTTQKNNIEIVEVSA
ncbi:DUF362 domain-containing protein [Candidatus Poribacteria bacterium]|nr:DUF362 domain-containing protein [Candidatus Poribacteria bacterium]